MIEAGLLAIKMLVVLAVLPVAALFSIGHAAVLVWQICLEVWHAFPGRH
jgi:hypothetical protein